MTWTEIITIEPYLEKVRQDAFKEKKGNWKVWESYKNRFRYLVGWYSDKEALVGEYDTVYQTILEAYEN